MCVCVCVSCLCILLSLVQEEIDHFQKFKSSLIIRLMNIQHASALVLKSTAAITTMNDTLLPAIMGGFHFSGMLTNATLQSPPTVCAAFCRGDEHAGQ